jgi:hypothetical protein
MVLKSEVYNRYQEVLKILGQQQFKQETAAWTHAIKQG